MVGEHQHPEILTGVLHGLLHRGNESAVEILNGPDFLFQKSLMSHFVRGFHMDIDEIAAVFGQGVDGGLRLALKIRVMEPVAPGT